jgi:hypothetical protein
MRHTALYQTSGAPAPSDEVVTPGSGPAGGPSSIPPLTTIFLLDPAQARQMQREDLQPGPFSPRCRYSLQIKVLHLQQPQRRDPGLISALKCISGTQRILHSVNGTDQRVVGPGA